jgi:hypothetical protein
MNKLICPICGTPTSIEPVIIESPKALLPDESTSTSSVYGKARVFAVTDNDSPHYVSYGVFECQACGERFVAKKHRYDDAYWVAIYPLPHKLVAGEIPEPIKSDFEEANKCFAIGARKACVAMCQIALEALWRDKGVSGLNQLKDNGIISTSLFNRATEIRLWAGVIKHKTLSESVSEEDAAQLLTYLEVILNDVYVEPKRLEGVKH